MTKKIEPKIYKVACSIPNEGVTRPESYDNHLIVAFHLGLLQERWKHENRPIRYEFYWFTTGRILTPMAREKLAENALKEGADYLMFWDDDMILPIDMVETLLYDMEDKPEIDVLAALAFMRNPPHYPVIYTSTEGYDSVRHLNYYSTQVVKNYPRNTLVECDAVGFGAVLIKTSILKNMKAPYFFNTAGTGEDVYFCVKAKKETGARVFMDTRVKLGHIGAPKIVDEDVFDAYTKEHGEKIMDTPHKYTTLKGDE